MPIDFLMSRMLSNNSRYVQITTHLITQILDIAQMIMTIHQHLPIPVLLMILITFPLLLKGRAWLHPYLPILHTPFLLQGYKRLYKQPPHYYLQINSNFKSHIRMKIISLTTFSSARADHGLACVPVSTHGPWPPLQSAALAGAQQRRVQTHKPYTLSEPNDN